ncbi:hypothetical protein FZC35_00785 [Candidatus Cytomitobacter indipagum]|uniref:Disease resistance R13L4/SHOC-2-like LRR domain-containing protein n=1 Tax=Candidatus Cytomitobacter indipagum TaxID=2601575 RepID=A0A5C0UDZ1_9PROT|nr:leucine-rich repeat domain-containing protein [Candidatus Cytomitobacter indipagum]QEK37920.1 hypothetical protein FZC35_00785 [Candidatus Cytomitobacter indipagum]
MKYRKILQFISIICVSDIKSDKELFNKSMSEINAYNSSDLKRLETEKGYKECLLKRSQEEALKMYCAYQIRKKKAEIIKLPKSYDEFKENEANNFLYMLCMGEKDVLKELKSIKLTNWNLKYIPSNMFDGLESLKYLNISLNQLTELPKEIGKLKSLTVLDIENNNLTKLPEEVLSLSLDAFCYSGNDRNLISNSEKILKEVSMPSFERLPKEIDPRYEYLFIEQKNDIATSLEKRSLYNPNVTILSIVGDEGIDRINACDLMLNFPKLEKLKLFDVESIDLPIWIRDLKSLTKLSIGRNDLFAKKYNLAILQNWIGELRNLTKLCIVGNDLTELPNGVAELRNLIKLDISRNKLTALPEAIRGLKNLMTLRVKQNKLNKLPYWIGELRNLEELNVLINELTELPDDTKKLRNLTNLNASYNDLAKLPSCIGELKNLIKLCVSGNQIAALPEGVAELKNLTELNIGNQLIELPNWISKLNQLKLLDLANNKLTALPREIGDLENLTSLYIGGNQLTVLPREIGKLKSLTDLNVRDSQLTELPREIGRLTNLTTLDVTDNKLTRLPKEICSLTFGIFFESRDDYDYGSRTDGFHYSGNGSSYILRDNSDPEVCKWLGERYDSYSW